MENVDWHLGKLSCHNYPRPDLPILSIYLSYSSSQLLPSEDLLRIVACFRVQDQISSSISSIVQHLLAVIALGKGNRLPLALISST
jgi:hypothetical protein